jgi:hypothetical protein
MMLITIIQGEFMAEGRPKPFSVRTSQETARTTQAIKFNTGVNIGDIIEDSVRLLRIILYRDPTTDELAEIVAEINEKYGRSIK